MAVTESPGSARSRSTSAGSSSSPVTLPDISYPSPFLVRNTFIDCPAGPNSLVDFLHDRQVQSCPTSGIGAPPGLEHLRSVVDSDCGDLDFMPVKPEEYPDDSPKKVAPVDFGIRHSLDGLPDFDYPSPFVVRNTFLDAPQMQPLGSLLDFMTDRQAQSCPASGIGMPPMPAFLSGASTGCSSFGSAVESHVEAEIPAPPSFEPILPQICAGAVLPPPLAAPMPPPPPAAPPSIPEAHLAAASAVAPPPPAQAPQLRISESLPHTELGTAAMPTVGSASHRFGTCKPCAFFHTKGCGSGVECTFCHLCLPGEKKRRQKAKQVASKISANLTASGMDPSLAVNAAARLAAAQAATMANMYRA